MSPIEQVARAIYAERYLTEIAFGAMPTWEDAQGSDKTNTFDEARAAIEAMSPATDTMKVAGGLKCEAIMFEGEGSGVIFNDMGEVFAAMITAALDEPMQGTTV
ncbi:hypothetical protein GGQ99_005060 [Aminobacter niigataensis]|uniref:Uncharacterized protein n=1 Tax=Aminobacter niigataensis TaxID=83265 RepID=A0ABR6L960_9HYPH|nr:hypothetical protein [Aminobacter niigataensis]MBB4653275.1 hypothetical protein [Aminobacter niigataensis]